MKLLAFQSFAYIYSVVFSLEAAGSSNKPNAAQIELRLVQSIDIIRKPGDLYQAEVVTVNQ